VAIGCFLLTTIGGYFINGYYWLLVVFLLTTIGGYFINGY